MLKKYFRLPYFENKFGQGDIYDSIKGIKPLHHWDSYKLNTHKSC